MGTSGNLLSDSILRAMTRGGIYFGIDVQVIGEAMENLRVDML